MATAKYFGDVLCFHIVCADDGEKLHRKVNMEGMGGLGGAWAPQLFDTQLFLLNTVVGSS